MTPVRVLVTYADDAGDVRAAAAAATEREAGAEAWQQLVDAVGADEALARYRQTVHLLPQGATVKYVVHRGGDGAREVVAYSVLRTARVARDVLERTTPHPYVVRPEVRT